MKTQSLEDHCTVLRMLQQQDGDLTEIKLSQATTHLGRMSDEQTNVSRASKSNR